MPARAPVPRQIRGLASRRCARHLAAPPGVPRPTPAAAWPRPPRLRLLLAFLAGLVVVLLILVIGGYFYLDGKLHRSNVLVSYAGQPAAGSGSNWLITGSDSRQGLSRKQERRYHTGIDVNGQRSDTILLLHIPGNGGPAVLVSLPADGPPVSLRLCRTNYPLEGPGKQNYKGYRTADTAAVPSHSGYNHIVINREINHQLARAARVHQRPSNVAPIEGTR